MTNFRGPKVYTLSAALEKARKYCAYQERSQQEVRDKLYDLGLHKNEVEQGIAILIEDGFLNEQRFAIAFAGGKFRINKWGKVKIRMALQSKKVSAYCVKQALSQIADADYRKTLIKVLNDRRKKVKASDPLKQSYQVAQYAISRGFEPDLVWDVLKMND
jgi:regulatory protein